jgi:hypothetical protein
MRRWLSTAVLQIMRACVRSRRSCSSPPASRVRNTVGTLASQSLTELLLMAAAPAGTGAPAWTPEAAAATPDGRRARGRPGDRPSGKVAWSAAKCHPAVLALNPALIVAPAPASSSAPASARGPRTLALILNPWHAYVQILKQLNR